MTAQLTQVSEFDRQLENLLTKGYSEILGMSEQEFSRKLEPLKTKLPANLKPLEDGNPHTWLGSALSTGRIGL